MHLCATLDRWTPLVFDVLTVRTLGVQAILNMIYVSVQRNSRSASDKHAESPDQGSYAVQLRATLDR